MGGLHEFKVLSTGEFLDTLESPIRQLINTIQKFITHSSADVINFMFYQNTDPTGKRGNAMKFIYTLVYSKHQGIRILRHALFWITDFVNWALVVSAYRQVSQEELLRTACILPVVMAHTYFILYYILPRFAKETQRVHLLLSIAGVLLLVGVALRLYQMYILYPLFDSDTTTLGNIWDIRLVIAEMFKWLAVMGMAVMIKLLKTRTELQQHNEQLQNEKKQAELNFLKAQMQPHFLFNTLNTLYAETIQESGNAQQVVLHLSSLMRFILDECNQPSIPLHHEIKVMKDFIALEQLRHGQRLNVNLQVGELDTNARISPLIFLPFIENSFKHSLAHVRGVVQINIQVDKRDNNIFLWVENDAMNGKQKNGVVMGKGILNTQRQLDLLYGKRYSLNIAEANGKHQVTLQVPTGLVYE